MFIINNIQNRLIVPIGKKRPFFGQFRSKFAGIVVKKREFGHTWLGSGSHMYHL